MDDKHKRDMEDSLSQDTGDAIVYALSALRAQYGLPDQHRKRFVFIELPRQCGKSLFYEMYKNARASKGPGNTPVSVKRFDK